MQQTIFTKLVSYSQNPNKESFENFVTEIINHLINHDKRFRESFLKIILKNNRKLFKRFKNCESETQKHYGNGIVDLVLNADNERMLIEVKTGSNETKTLIWGKGRQSQIKKYLSYNDGNVAYLTTNNISDPNIGSNKRYLGHFYFEDLYLSLNKRKLCEIGEEFKKFMEENNMMPPKPFTKKEVKHATLAFDFAWKCEEILDEVQKGIIPFFKKELHTSTDFTRVKFSNEYITYFYPKRFNKHPCNKLWFRIFVDKDNKLYFGTEIKGNDEDMRKLNKKLRWRHTDSGGLYSSYEIKGNEDIIKKMKSLLKKDILKLRKTLRNF